MDNQSTLLHQIARFELTALEAERVFAQITEHKNWADLLRQIELHALAPLLLSHAQQHDASLESEQLMSLRALSMRHRAAADARYQAYVAIKTLFDQHKVPMLALKGLGLAPLLYSPEYLRPMRDMDILVPLSALPEAERLMREAGFDLPETQPTRFMRDAHQLPNATKKINGLIVSVEIHHDALGREFLQHLRYEDLAANAQIVKWRDSEVPTLGHADMLHQICKHVQGLHPGDYIKLINLLDIVGYAEHFQTQIDWPKLAENHSHVLNTLKCLHLVIPLSSSLQLRLGIDGANPKISNVGETMIAMRRIFKSRRPLLKKLSLLLNPSDWWLHLYYNVDPSKSLICVKSLRHPLNVLTWIFRRAYTGAFGKE